MAIFLVAAAVRAIYLVQLAATPFTDERGLVADSRYYDLRASQIAAGDWLPDVPGFLSPFYCYFLGLFYRLGGGFAGIQWLQLSLGAVSAVLLYRIGASLWDEETGRIAGLLLALYGPHVYYTGVTLPAVTILALHLALIWVLVNGDSLPRYALAGALIGAAILAKANALLLLPALALWTWRRDGTPRDKAAACAVLAACAALVVAPMTWANYRVTGELLLVTSTGGANLFKGNGPTANGTHAFLPPGVQATGILAHRLGQVDPARSVAETRELSRMAREYVLAHPWRSVKLWVKKLLLLFNHRELGIRDSYSFVRETQVPLLRYPLLAFWAVAVPGLAGAVRPGAGRRGEILYAVAAVQVASFVIVFVLGRYRLVLVACLMLFAAHLIRRIRAHARLRAAVAVLAAALVFLPFPEFPRGRGWADQYAFVARRAEERGDWEAAVRAWESALDADWTDWRRIEGSRAQVEERLGAARAALAAQSPSPT